MPSPRSPRGVNLRRQVAMDQHEVDTFLDEPHTMSFCTVNFDGSIHAVAMWYGFLDGAVAVQTKAKSQKARNARRDPRCTMLFVAGDTYDELRGVELVGQLEVVSDPEQMFELGMSVFSRYYAPYDESRRDEVLDLLNKRVVLKLHVERTVSWDHRKIVLP